MENFGWMTSDAVAENTTLSAALIETGADITVVQSIKLESSVNCIGVTSSLSPNHHKQAVRYVLENDRILLLCPPTANKI